MRKKTLAWVLIASGCVALVAAILFAFAVGGGSAFALLLLSVLLNALGVTVIRFK